MSRIHGVQPPPIMEPTSADWDDQASFESFPASADWDVVDQAGLESFPASDPPAWGSHHAVPSASTVALPEISVPDVRSIQPRRLARIVRVTVAAGIALGGLILLATKFRRRRR